MHRWFLCWLEDREANRFYPDRAYYYDDAIDAVRRGCDTNDRR